MGRAGIASLRSDGRCGWHRGTCGAGGGGYRAGSTGRTAVPTGNSAGAAETDGQDRGKVGRCGVRPRSAAVGL